MGVTIDDYKWFQERYNNQANKRHAAANADISSSNIGKEENIIQKRSLYNFGKQAGKLITLVLATQVAFVQASEVSVTQQNSKPEDDLTNHINLSTPLERSNQIVELTNSLQNMRSSTEIVCGDDDTCNIEENRVSILIDSYLKSGFMQLNQYGGPSVQQTDCDLCNVCSDSYAQFQKKVNEIKRKASQQYLPKVNRSDTNLQLLFTVSASNVKLELMPVMKELCISELGKGHIETAVDILKKITDAINAQVLKDIIEKACGNCDQLNNLDNILNFAEQLHSLSDKVISYEALYEKFEKNNPRILIFYTQVRKDIENQQIYKNNSALVQRLNDLKNKLIIPVNKVLDAWAYKICNNYYQEIIEFAKKHSNCVNDNLDQLIEKAYAKKLENADTILKFILDLPYTTNAIVAYSSLFGKMKDNNHLDSYQLLMLANKVKEYMEMPYYSIVSQDYKDKFTKLKDVLLPNSVRRLIWNGDNCIIHNMRDDRPLYAAWKQKSKSNNKEPRLVFIWIPGRCDSECNWSFTSKTYNEIFSLKYKVYGENLYAEAASTELDYFKYVAYTSNENYTIPQSYWKLKPINNGSFFTIKNTLHNAYLCGAYDLSGKKPSLHFKDRRFVFAQDNYQPTICDWKIQC